LSRDPIAEQGFNVVNFRALVDALWDVQFELSRLRVEISLGLGSISSFEDVDQLLSKRLQTMRLERVEGKLKEHLATGIKGVSSSMNEYNFVFNKATNEIDILGLDVWVGNRPWSLHQNINVGDPNGSYVSYSFALYLGEWSILNPFAASGIVYPDDDVPTEINEDMYLETTALEDYEMMLFLLEILEDYSQDGFRARYGRRNCRSWSQDLFDYFQLEYGD
jgi:hypothetical protein